MRFIYALLLLLPSFANAQILQGGTVTPGHVGAWSTNGVLSDGGAATNGSLTAVGVQNSGYGICQNSGPVTGTYTQICLGFVAGVPTINVQGTGGVNALNFNINGTTSPLPTASSYLPVTGGTLTGMLTLAPLSGGATIASSTINGSNGNLTISVPTNTGDLLLNAGAALNTAATTGFVHLPFTTSAPTGTPTNTNNGPACEWNTSTHVLNCYDGSSWYNFVGTGGAG